MGVISNAFEVFSAIVQSRKPKPSRILLQSMNEWNQYNCLSINHKQWFYNVWSISQYKVGYFKCDFLLHLKLTNTTAGL